MYNNNVVLIDFTGVFISCTLKVASVHKRGTLRHARARSRHALARTFLLARYITPDFTRFRSLIMYRENAYVHLIIYLPLLRRECQE